MASLEIYDSSGSGENSLFSPHPAGATINKQNEVNRNHIIGPVFHTRIEKILGSAARTAAGSGMVIALSTTACITNRAEAPLARRPTRAVTSPPDTAPRSVLASRAARRGYRSAPNQAPRCENAVNGRFESRHPCKTRATLRLPWEP